MTVNRETREAVAKAIYCVARPGHAWFHEPPAVLEYWGSLADAAIAAGCRGSVRESEHVHDSVSASPVEGLAGALGLPDVVEAILKEFPLDGTGHVQDCGYDAGTCRCSTLPRRLARVVSS